MDRRIKKTKRTIHEVFLQLLREKPIGAITAQEIAERADISRSTFYQHYTDIYDLLDQAEVEIFNEISALLNEYTYTDVQADPLHLFTELFFYFKRNAKICDVLINKNGSITTGQRITKMIQEKFRHEWEALIHCGDPIAERYLSQYIISGFVGILQEWIAGGMEVDETEIASITKLFIHRSLSKDNSNKSKIYEEAEIEMSSLKEKIRGDAKAFAGGVLNDTSEFIQEKSGEIQKKVEAGIGVASTRLTQKGNNLQSGGSTGEDRERQRNKLLKKRGELENKHEEKIAKLSGEGKKGKLAEEQEKYEKELLKINKRLEELDISEF